MTCVLKKKFSGLFFLGTTRHVWARVRARMPGWHDTARYGTSTSTHELPLMGLDQHGTARWPSLILNIEKPWLKEINYLLLYFCNIKRIIAITWVGKSWLMESVDSKKSSYCFQSAPNFFPKKIKINKQPTGDIISISNQSQKEKAKRVHRSTTNLLPNSLNDFPLIRS